jgi:DNA-binding transcriptional regulator YhcF (GntR family)
MVPKLDLAVDRGADVPLGAQLAARIRAALTAGALAAGDRLPSVRELAEAAGVNVNTARAVYARLESEGIVRSEQGRGTFVSGAASDEAATRRELRRQIAQLEAALARLPPPPTLANEARPAAKRPGPAALSTDGLEAVRDELFERLSELEAQRTAVLQRLRRLGVEDSEQRTPSRRATPSLAGARIRWVGA